MTGNLILPSESGRSLAVVGALATPHITNPREAFAWALAASRALPASELAPLNVDIKLAPCIVLGALPKILTFRARLASLADFNLAHVDTLAWHAQATMQAEVHYMGACSGPAHVAELAKQARTWRFLLLQDMAIMVTRGLLSAKKHAELKLQAGYKDLPFLLMALTLLYRNEWPKLSAYTTVRERELDEATTTAEQLSFAYASRADRNIAVNAANDRRRRNFTLLAQAYDQVRRGLSYLRWNEGDLEEIAPSLYRGRGGSRRKPAPAAPKTESPVAPPNG
jgi:hypothetical protein